MVIFVFSPENPLEVIFAPVYMLINIVRNLTCWHAYILNGRHYFHVLLFSRVVIFAFFLKVPKYHEDHKKIKFGAIGVVQDGGITIDAKKYRFRHL